MIMSAVSRPKKEGWREQRWANRIAITMPESVRKLLGNFYAAHTKGWIGFRNCGSGVQTACPPIAVESKIGENNVIG